MVLMASPEGLRFRIPKEMDMKKALQIVALVFAFTALLFSRGALARPIRIGLTGLSGESVILKDAKGNPVERKNPEGKMEPVVLWKTLQINYHIPDDDKFPGIDIIELEDQQWVMR